jgi:hypothetical protein
MGGRTAQRCIRACIGEPGLLTAHRFTLAQMGAHALDSQGRDPHTPTGVYWGGHGLLALEVFGADTKSNRRKIRRALVDLEERKLIRVYDPNEGGRKAYQLLPENPP